MPYLGNIIISMSRTNGAFKKQFRQEALDINCSCSFPLPPSFIVIVGNLALQQAVNPVVRVLMSVRISLELKNSWEQLSCIICTCVHIQGSTNNDIFTFREVIVILSSSRMKLIFVDSNKLMLSSLTHLAGATSWHATVGMGPSLNGREKGQHCDQELMSTESILPVTTS